MTETNPTDPAALGDHVTLVVTPDAAPIYVPGTQSVDMEGVKGPDEAQWADPESRPVRPYVPTDNPGEYKPAGIGEWSLEARADRGAHPDDNPRPETDTAAELPPVEVVVDDAVG